MDIPEKLVFSEDTNTSIAWGGVLIGLAIMALSLLIGLITTDFIFSEWVLPMAALGSFWLVWVGFFSFVSWIHRINDKRAIKRMFEGEIWECWQFSAQEWHVLVDEDCNLISPEEEGLSAYVGAVYSSIFGIIFAAIMLAVGAFAFQDPQGKTIIQICALVVFLVFLGVGLFQPVVARFKARRYRRKAQRVPEPRVWFTFDGIYHETLGFTSLKHLEKVTDQTRSRKAIQFSLLESSADTATELVPYSFPVPAGCERRAAYLVRRYRQERLIN
jgi:threonine/homoserine/homoserine lactone efflux protein